MSRFKKLIKRIIFIRKYISKINESHSKGKHRLLILNSKYDFFHTILHYCLARMLSHYGVSTTILSDDGVLSHYDNSWNEIEKNKYLRRLKNKVSFYKKKLFLFLSGIQKTKHISFLYYSEFKVNDIKIEDHYDSIIKAGELPSHLEGSHRRYFGGRPFDKKNTDHTEFLKHTLENYLINLSIGSQIHSEKIDLVITLDGLYTTTGALFDYLRVEKGIRGVVHQTTSFQERAMYIGEKPYFIGNELEAWKMYLNSNPIKTNNGIEFLKSRTAKLYEPYTKIELEVFGEIQAQVNQLEAKGVIGIFPNLTWDGAINERNTIFNSLEDWIFKTLEICEKNNLLLVIREHPQAEGVYSERDSICALLDELSFNNNFQSKYCYIIPGIKKVNSFKLSQKFLDYNLVLNGTLIQEFSYLQLPTVACGNSAYTGKGIVYEPKSLEEFEEQLLAIANEGELANFKKQSELHAQFHFYENSYYFPMLPRLKDVAAKDRYWINWEYINFNDPRVTRTLEKFMSYFS